MRNTLLVHLPFVLPLLVMCVALPLGSHQLGAHRSTMSLLDDRRPLRVVTDVDDTIKSSGNKRVAGIALGGTDAQFERGTFYPGVCQFALELARAKRGDSAEPLRVAILTARAREFLFALQLDEKHPVNLRYRACGEGNGVKEWGLGPVLYGSVQEWICQERKGWRKFENFSRLVALDRDPCTRCSMQTPVYVFIGDTGEGDEWAGRQMCTTHPEIMLATFLHVVSDKQPCEVPSDLELCGIPIFYFKTYVGAATKAYRAGLMGADAMKRVMESAKSELDLVDPSRHSSKWTDLSADLAEAER
jgi:hypothetical protein